MADARILLSAVDHTKAAIDSAQRNLKGLSATASGVAARFGSIGLAITAAFTAVSMKGAIDAADNLDDLSEKTGIAVESLGALRYAGEVTGTPLEALATGTRTLARTMAEAAGGNKEYAATFKTLGVEVKNQDGTLRAQEAVLLDLADRFARYEDGAGKSALAQEVFGKSGADLIPLLNQGSAGIRALTTEAEALGAVYSGSLARDAALFNDNLKKLELNAEAAKVAIAGDLLPTLNNLLKTAIELAQVKGGIWGWLTGGENMGDLERPFQKIGEIEAKLANVRKQRQDIEGSAANKGPLRVLPLFGTVGDLQTLDVQEKKLNEQLEFYKQLDAVRRRQVSGEAARLENEYFGGGGRTAAPVVPGAAGKGADAAAKEAKEQARLLAELSGVQGNYMEQLSRLQQLRANGIVGEERYVELVTELIEKQPMAKALMEEAARAERDFVEARQRANDLQQRHLDGLASENEAIIGRNLSLSQEVEELGLNAAALDLLTETRLRANLAREEENLLAARNIEGNEADVAALERKVRLMRQELQLTQQRSIKRADVEFQDKAKEESEAYSKDLHSDLKGAIQRAFEDSENPVQAFAKGLASVIYSRLTTSLAESIADGLLGPMQQALGGLKGGGGGSGFGGILTSIFGGGMFAGGYGAPMNPYVMHGGGIAGQMSLATRMVSPAVFAGARRYHTGGLAGDEVPAILQRGEGVFTKEQMRALGGGEKSSAITIVNPPGSRIERATETRLSSGERQIILHEAAQRAVKQIRSEISNPNSKTSKGMESDLTVRRRRS